MRNGRGSGSLHLSRSLARLRVLSGVAPTASLNGMRRSEKAEVLETA
jgi:hypothetical protein